MTRSRWLAAVTLVAVLLASPAIPAGTGAVAASPAAQADDPPPRELTLTINGEAADSVTLTAGTPFAFTITGETDAATGGPPLRATLDLTASSGASSSTLELATFDLDAAEIGGVTNIPASIGLLPPDTVFTLTAVAARLGGPGGVVTRYQSNTIAVTLLPLKLAAFTATLAVNGETSGPVPVRLDVPFTWEVSRDPAELPDGVTVGYLLYLTVDPALRANPSFFGSQPAGVAVIANLFDGSSGQVTLPADGGPDPAGTYFLGAVAIVTNGDVTQIEYANVVRIDLSGDAAPTVTDLARTLATDEDTPVTTAFSVGDDLTAAGELLVSASAPARGDVTLGGSGASRTLTYTPDPDATGTDRITLTVSDGRFATTRTVDVTIAAVNDPPVIDDASIPDDAILEATGPDGATLVTDRIPRATDADGESVTPVCTREPLSGPYPLGTTSVACTATDGSGLTDTADFTVTVRDTTGPGTITFAGAIRDGATYARRALPSAPTCSATDAVDGPLAGTVTGYQTGFGTHILTCTATDAAGNSATATLTYTVAERAVGPTATPRPTSPPPPPSATPRPRTQPTATPPPAPAEPTVRPTPRPRR